jgi:hypothetical protein
MQFISRIFGVVFNLHQRVREILAFIGLDPNTARKAKDHDGCQPNSESPETASGGKAKPTAL